MLKYQTFVSLKRMLRIENAKHFLQQHRDQIKTVALPCLVLAAVLFFWFYGNAQDSEQVHMEDAQTAAENQPTETQQAELAGSETKGRRIYRSKAIFMSIFAGKLPNRMSIVSRTEAGSLR